MSTTKKQTTTQTFTVAARVTVEVGIDVVAASLEDALDYARGLGVGDVVQAHGVLNDSSPVEVVLVGRNVPGL